MGILVLFVALLLIPCAAQAEDDADFDWSWAEEGSNPPAATPAQDTTAATATGTGAGEDDDSFSWSWAEDGKTKAKQPAAPTAVRSQPKPVEAETPILPPRTMVSKTPAPAQPAPPTRQAVDTSAYDKLLKENLALRKKMATTEVQADTARKENTRLSRQVVDMDKRITQFAVKMSDLKKRPSPSPVPSAAPATGAGAADLERIRLIERELALAKQEEAKLGKILSELGKADGPLSATRAPTHETVKGRETTWPPPGRTKRAARPAAAPARRAVSIKPMTDLMRELEKQNLALKDMVTRARGQHDRERKSRIDWEEKCKKAEEKAELATEKQELLKERLDLVKKTEQEQARTMSKLFKQVPHLEAEALEQKSRVAQKQSVIELQQKDIDVLRMELERREHRLQKMDRMTSLLAEARDDVKTVSDKDKLNMHYNMGVVYAKEGAYREAEQEYLLALRINPNDPGVHYNLGILYDDSLNDKHMAAMHYRKYLKLTPHTADAERVRHWLMKLESQR